MIKIVTKDENGNIISGDDSNKIIERTIVKTERIETVKIIKTLDDFKEVKLQELKTSRDIEIDSTINNFDVDELKDRENIQGALANFESLISLGVNHIWADEGERILSVETTGVGFQVNTLMLYTYIETAWVEYQEANITWSMADNTEKQVTKEELKAVLDAYIVRKAKAFSKYQEKKALIDSATTLEELEAISL